MGRQKAGQGDLMASWSEMPRSPGHVFYGRLQSVLIEGGFDAFAEASCRPYYAARMGAPSVPPGRISGCTWWATSRASTAERGLEWRCSDSLSLRAFLRLGSRDRYRTIALAVIGAARACPMKSTRRSSTGFWC